jgi:hypothetical protein
MIRDFTLMVDEHDALFELLKQAWMNAVPVNVVFEAQS